MIYHWISITHNITILVFPDGDGIILGWRGPDQQGPREITQEAVGHWLRSSKCHSIERCVCG